MPQYPIHGSKYFDVREFVHPRTWTELDESATLCAWMIDPKIVRVADLIRELTGVPVVVNNWHYAAGNEKIYRSSGYRAKWDTTGAAYSQHRAGRAADFKVRGCTPAALLKIIDANLKDFLAAGLTTIEDVSSTPTWLHCDCRPRSEGAPDLLIVQP